MKQIVTIYVSIFLDFKLILGLTDSPSLGLKNIPRLVKSKGKISDRLEYPVYQNHTVYFHEEGSEEYYVGGTDFVFKIDIEHNHIIEKFPLNVKVKQQCSEGLCENIIITVIQKFQDSLFVCGTNGNTPLCWKLPTSQVNNRSYEMEIEGTGISPYLYTQNSMSLTVEGDLYAAAPLDSVGRSLQFRRKAGSRTNVWMYDEWVSEPTFVSASWVRRNEDPDNEKIYVFFREKNSDNNPEADPWISRVARFCKVDEGGSKIFFQNTWTSFLKARLVCGFPNESLYFNRLQDIYVLHAENWNDTRVYALFISSWNSTAVCVYSMAEIDHIFESSSFKGYEKEIPKPRPGTCVKNSKKLPLETIHVIKDHPEMTDWIQSRHTLSPFYVSNYNYTKIAVDRVKAADHQVYNILFLSTDSGKIHKILEASSKPLIISEIQLSNHSAIQSMKLDSIKKKLIVGFAEQIYNINLYMCQDYNGSCEECVLARDPYCAWTKNGCTSAVMGGIQNMTGGETNVCSTATESKNPNRTKRETMSSPPLASRETMSSPPLASRETMSSPPLASRENHTVPLGLPFYLSCPIDSYHATYTWDHHGQVNPCMQMQSDCLHLILAMSDDSYGNYKCISKEKYYTKVIKDYNLTKQQDTKRHEKSTLCNKSNDAIAVVSQTVPVIIAAVVAVLPWFKN